MNAFQINYRRPAWLLAFALSAFVVGCGGGGDDAATPGPRVDTPVVVDPVGGVCAGADCVALGTAGNYTILALSGVTNVPTSKVTGHIGLNAAAVGITGFAQTMDATGTFATAAEVTGKIYASDYAAPTPAALTTAVTDTGAAFTEADNKVLSIGDFDQCGCRGSYRVDSPRWRLRVEYWGFSSWRRYCHTHGHRNGCLGLQDRGRSHDEPGCDRDTGRRRTFQEHLLADCRRCGP